MLHSPALRSTLALIVLAAAGCSMRQPIKVCMQGDIDAAASMKLDNNVSQVSARTLPGEPCSGPRIALIDIDGLLVNRNLTGMSSMGENPVALLREKLQRAERDPCVAAVVLRVNSPGGGVTACDIMRWELTQFRQRSGKPVVACLMDVGAGGAYYIATAADVITAHPTTITGGVGVILNLYDLQDFMQQQNVVENVIRSGEKIDMGTPTRTMDADEAAILEGIAAEFHKRFKDAVLAARPALATRAGSAEVVPLPGASPSDADPEDADSELADSDLLDGRVLTGSDALRLGMVDELGYLEDAVRLAEGAAGVIGAKTIVYRRDNDRALTPYDITPNVPGGGLMPFSLPGVDRALLPTFLYLWQPEPAYEKTSGP
ncbi:putative signal peptide peptidase SppA [Posidoniimonas polymericola]|uniref:Putative signal peptide peptidase SppA n=1 Tax=Posidoniimonas polymericola TaxID=2528002 RepID=A0A5C5YUS8_9BACT|nr:S49 family peptidase [Posidoniimonas polymericola]TWT78571.1 putative signal peptide peptidase SppA [Posidoniimonas polymericola]